MPQDTPAQPTAPTPQAGSPPAPAPAQGQQPASPAPTNARTLTYYRQHPAEAVYDYAPRTLGALAFLVAAFVIAGWLRRILPRILLRVKVEPTLAKFFGNAAKWLILALGVIQCLSIFGVNTTSFAALLGAVGVAIGLGLQGTLGHLAAGILLLLFRPFKVGDSVVIAGQTGTVDTIDLFTTKLDTADNRRILVPNGMIMGAIIENTTYHRERVVELTIGLDPKVKGDQSRMAFERALKRVGTTVEGILPAPPPQITLVSIGQAAITWQVRLACRTDVYGVVRDELIRACKSELEVASL